MRLIHSADWHFGASPFLDPTHQGKHLERSLGVYDAIVDLAVERGINTIVVAGDLFDVDEPSPREAELFLERMLAYDRMGIRILAIRGNHDQSDTQGRTAIRYLDRMTTAGVFTHSVFTETTKWERVGDTLFLLLCHRPRFFHEDLGKALADLREGSMAVPFKDLVIVMHETVRGAVTDTNWRLKDGVDVPPLDHGETIPDIQGSVYFAVGDIHIHQRLGRTAFYSGAPMQVKFGDQAPKGVLIVDTDDPSNPEFVAIESKRLVRVVEDANGVLPAIPEDVFTKIVASPEAYAAAAEAGLITEDAVRFEAMKKPTSTLTYAAGMDLAAKVYSGLEALLTGDDLVLAKNEAHAVFSGANVSS